MKGWKQSDIDNLTKKSTLKKATIKMPSISTNALTKHALTILNIKGFHCWRQNNAAVYDPTLKVFRKGSSTPGVSDILGFHRKTGKFIACEIKAAGDTLSEEQEAFLSDVNQSGGIGIVVKSIDDLDKFLQEKV